MGFLKDCEEVLIIDGVAVILAVGWGEWVPGILGKGGVLCACVYRRGWESGVGGYFL